MAVLFRRRLVNFLRLLWVLVIVWYEYGTFLSDVRVCKWPDASLLSETPDTIPTARPHHVLLVADPQIVDRYSYPSRGTLLSYLTRVIVDLNLRKSWQAALQKKPDVIVFLGDMMDNGRYNMSDEEYEGLFERFSNIFRNPKKIPQYFIPGNHDIGLGKSSYFSPNAFRRYASHFGTPNFELSVANHSLIFFDAPRYADEDSTRHGQKKLFNKWTPITGGSLEYMKAFANEKHTDPVILFSHIPLYRSDGKDCGPLREHGTLRPGVGFGYQNTLEKQSTLRLVEAFKPVAVFSGDDHDYCEYTHKLRAGNEPIQTVQEVTVKTISMVMNVRRPGFQLLSLASSDLRHNDRPTYADTPCLLPDQLRIYLKIYLPLLVVSLILIFLNNMKRKFLGGSRDAEKVTFTMHINEASDKEEEDEDDDTEMSPYLSGNGSSSSQILPSPVTASFNKHSMRLPPKIKPGWITHREPERSLSERIRDVLCFFWSSRSRTLPHRRGWRYRFIRDVRDIAVFPVGLFVVITWWVVTK